MHIVDDAEYFVDKVPNINTHSLSAFTFENLPPINKEKGSWPS